jgi:DNA-binding transcriptional MerR regulator
MPPGERLYSIQQVALLLDLRAATLRAWERRFGIPRPRRAPNGYRLYSHADLVLLRQLKARTDAGLRIGPAVESLTRPGATDPVELDSLRYRLAEAILLLDERQAAGALREMLALNPVEEVLEHVVIPMLAWIGDEWRAGNASVGVEHFASAFFVRQLVALYLAAPDPWRPGRTVAACLPGEHHEIGLLTLTVGLRRRGWHVVYLGANLPFDAIERAAAGIKPDMILLSATSRLDPAHISAVADVALRMTSLEAEVVLGGPAVRGVEAEVAPAEVLDGGFSEMLAELETILVRGTHVHTNR